MISDNTNIRPWESEAYTTLARVYDYKILILTFDPRDLEIILEVQNSVDGHGVTKETLERMIRDYFIFDDLLNPKIMVNPNNHVNYRWDREKEERVDIRVSKHFDSDMVLRIVSSEFKEKQLTIGQEVLKIIGDNK